MQMTKQVIASVPASFFCFELKKQNKKNIYIFYI